MTNARDKANIPVLNFQSKGIDDNADATAITINSSEQVGIGTASPDHLLHISANSTNAQLKLQRTGSATASFNIAASSDSLAFSDQAASTERMRITSTGLGIGTSSPANNLHIHTDVSGEGILVKSTGNTYNEIIADANRTGSADTLGRFRGNWNTNPVAFISINTGDDTTNKDDGRIIFSTSSSGSSPTERMRIQPNGNVGIGTSSPAHNVEIVATNSGSINDTLQIRNNTTTTGSGSRLRFITSTDLNSDTNGASIASVRNGNDNDLVFEVENSEAMRIDHAGNVGIGTTSPESGSLQTISHPGSSKYGLNLDSSNTSGTQYHLQFKRGGTQAGYITSNSATTIAVNNASDERLKENIQNSGSAIQDIKDIQVRQFDWVDGIDTHRDFGFVAQELVNVVPEAVTQGTDELDDNGKPVRSWGVDYSHIVPRLVKVCQEQQTKIEDLEARITALETNQP